MAQMTITQFMTGIKNWVLGKIENITALIPSQASSSNQLADKAFVNSSIATATATFRGTYNVVSDLSLSYNATHAQIQTALATKMSALSITPDNNDYAFVQIPTADATPTQIAKTEKYKYNGTAWAFEYELNSSGFTAAQWAAINSGATLELIGKLSALPTNAQLIALLDNKVSWTDNGAYDVTAHNSGATFASLSALLNSENLNTLIPTDIRKGGMSIKFVQSSDNKYVQYRLMSDSFNTTPANWQGVIEDVVIGDKNLVYSGDIYNGILKNTPNSMRDLILEGAYIDLLKIKHISGYYLAKNGKLYTYNNCFVSDFVECIPNTNYKLKARLRYDAAYVFYDKALNVIAGYNPDDGYERTITTPSDCHYIRYCSFDSLLDDMGLKYLGSTPYQNPYSQEIASKTICSTYAGRVQEICDFSPLPYTIPSGTKVLIKMHGGTAATGRVAIYLNSTSGEHFYINDGETREITLSVDLNKLVLYTDTFGSESFVYVEVIIADSILGNTLVLKKSVEQNIQDIQTIEDDVQSLKKSNTWLSVAMFNNMAVCGDSYTECGYNIGGGTFRVSSQSSWGSVLGRLNGIDISIFAKSGVSTETYLTNSKCLPALLAAPAKQLYVFCLGINDMATTKGTIDDIKPDYHDNPNTFYGNYGRIIAQTLEHAPNAKIIITKCFITRMGSYYQYSDAAVEAIANKFGVAFIDTKDSDFFMSDWYNDNLTENGNHPTLVGQSGMAVAMTELISKCIKDNDDYFNTFVGIE